jgi:hypothetical protein
MFRHETSIAPASYDEYVKMHSDEIEWCLLCALGEFKRVGPISKVPSYRVLLDHIGEVSSGSAAWYDFCAMNFEEFGFEVYCKLFRNDQDLVERIASDMAWALDYKLAMNFIKTQDGTPLAEIVSELYEYDYSEPEWRTKYDVDKDYVISVIEDELVGSHLVDCYFEWCSIFYNGYDQDAINWARGAGLDVVGLDFEEKSENAKGYMDRVFSILDFNVLPKSWLLDAIRKNRVESREDFHF